MAPGQRDRVVIVTCIVLITALAWTYLVALGRQMSSPDSHAASMMGMDMMVNVPWRASDVLFTFLMWAVMMIGMMSASAMPVLLLFAGMQARRTERGAAPTVPFFALGYGALWIGFSLVAALAQWALHETTLLSSNMETSSRMLGSAILIAAGVYQLTPAKRACLRRCQSPLGFLMGNWRDGPQGALRMGLRHGSYCLGCCWALMCVLFAVGVMNLAWVAALTVFILLEKTGRGGLHVARIGGVVMIGMGIALAVT